MYPIKEPDEGRAAVSQHNARDIVEAIDILIKLRVSQQEASKFVNGAVVVKASDEECALLKRAITDYLLVTDPRAGVFRNPNCEKPDIGPAKQ